MKKQVKLGLLLSLLLPLSAMAGEQCGGWKHGAHHGDKMRADTNKDGKVDKSEFIAHATQRAEEKFAHMDVNKDGVLDKRDHLAHFDRLDANHDGKISREEWESFHASKRSKHHTKGYKHE